MKLVCTAIALLALLPFSAAAREPRYTYVEGGYQYLDIDTGGADVNGGGFGLGGSVAISDRLHLLASYSQVDLDFGVDVSQFAAGVGGSWPMSEDVHLIGSLGYVSAELDTRFGDVDDSGIALSGGFRWMATERFELTSELNYFDLDDAGDDTTLSVSGLFDLTPDLALGVGATFGDDATGFDVGLRYYFPGRR